MIHSAHQCITPASRCGRLAPEETVLSPYLEIGFGIINIWVKSQSGHTAALIPVEEPNHCSAPQKMMQQLQGRRMFSSLYIVRIYNNIFRYNRACVPSWKKLYVCGLLFPATLTQGFLEGRSRHLVTALHLYKFWKYWSGNNYIVHPSLIWINNCPLMPSWHFAVLTRYCLQQCADNYDAWHSSLCP